MLILTSHRMSVICVPNVVGHRLVALERSRVAAAYIAALKRAGLPGCGAEFVIVCATWWLWVAIESRNQVISLVVETVRNLCE